MNTNRQVEPNRINAGELVIWCLAGALASLRDSLWDEGFHEAADVVADLSYRCDRYVEEVRPWRSASSD